MASSSPKAPCATCGNKTAGIFRCEGCLCVFCRKHLNEHRDVLSHQLDEVVLEYDTLQQTIVENKIRQNKEHPVVKEIEKWEKDSIVKIQQLAEEARQQVRTLTSSQTVSKELHDLAERLQKARIDDDYVETDIQSWTTILQKLKDEMNSHVPSIQVREDQSQILVARMYISTTATQCSKQTERFGESFGTVRIDNNGVLATHCGWKNGDVYVRGIGEYSSGKHYIRFLFQKKTTGYDTIFGVVSKITQIGTGESTDNSYGWSSYDEICPHDKSININEDVRDMSDETTFEIEFQLDCDNRKISYLNQGTKNRRELNVNTKRCPFPWQIEFYLFEVGDHVQFLS